MLNRGIANISKEQYDRALQDFDQAIKLKPDLAEAYVGRGDVWNNSGQPKRALACRPTESGTIESCAPYPDACP